MNKVKFINLLNSLPVKWDKSHGDWWMASCPLPDHQDRDPSFGINIVDNRANCFGCGKIPLFKAIAYLKGVKFSEAKRILKKGKTGNSVTSNLRLKLRQDTSLKSQKSVKTRPDPLPAEYEPLRASNRYTKYLKKRNLSIKLMKKYGVGFCREGYYEHRIVMPIYFNKKYKGFCARSILTDGQRKLLYEGTKRQKKYLYSKGLQATKILFNYDNIGSNIVFVTEGMIDSLTLINWGYKNSVATFSSKMSEEQAYLMVKKEVEELVLCYDKDRAGDIGVKGIQEKLKGEIRLSKLDLKVGKDINSISKVEFEKLMEKRSEIGVEKWL